jgi:flagellar hook-associated protein 1 FlgK
MSSISAVMNTAKWALLTHQKSLQVASHNIANVETPGFSRQELILQTGLPIDSSP